MKEKFYSNYEPQEIETHIWIDYLGSKVRIETNRKLQYYKLMDKLGEPTKKEYIKNTLCGAYWDIPFKDRKRISNIIKINLLLGHLS